MKIYVSHSRSFDYQNELYKPLQTSPLFNLHTIMLPHADGQNPINSKTFIKKCDLFIAEISYASTGQGIELGWADIFGVPILGIYKSGMKFSDSIKSVTDNFIEYKDNSDMMIKLSEYISKKF